MLSYTLTEPTNELVLYKPYMVVVASIVVTAQQLNLYEDLEFVYQFDIEATTLCGKYKRTICC